ncbi:MAG: CBS domain-containing protein [Pyrinomonadaceae bacterium]|nr:CBS domain-containing protein [Pyrinomonadaceae bacterium]
MKVKEIMTRSVGTCSPADSLADAVAVMWEMDCGAVPILIDDKPVGIVTDRDIAIALTTRNAVASDVSVCDVIGRNLVTCGEKEKATKALKKMERFGVRRLPVVNKKGRLTGLVALSDIINASGKNKKLRKKVLKTLQAISKPHPIVLFEKAE